MGSPCGLTLSVLSAINVMSLTITFSLIVFFPKNSGSESWLFVISKMHPQTGLPFLLGVPNTLRANPFSLICRLSFNAAIYHLWCERNRRIFARQNLPLPQLLMKVVRDIQQRLLSLTNISKDTVNVKLCHNFGLGNTLFKWIAFACTGHYFLICIVVEFGLAIESV